MHKASSSALRRRAGPLKDLPLELFLPQLPTPQRPNKRVHSPGGPSLFSPTKRRILAEEGIVSGASLKSPVRLRAVPVRRDSGDSPVKKLDFGPPKNSPTSARSPHNAPTSAPDSPATRLTRHSGSHSTADAFPTSASFPQLSDAQEMTDYFSVPSNASGVVQTPREIPPPVDPQSIHYPGFHVFQDAFIITGSSAAAQLSPQKDAQKENVAPRRKPRKSVTAPASSDLKSRLVFPDTGLAKASSMPSTPPRSLPVERLGSLTPTPRRPDVVLTRDTRLTPKLQDSERRELRRRLADEVDDIDDEDL
ncbi:hypothetical protein B0H16DRAFT_1298501 [Mycena metata]|uniref:Uncharacterized protein n=1 Tax=Mycena metata TaxID=1033252 RepID=A0AAD7NZ40_9AGAR|nr:hypothetical protein B0H16DRAFT_1298501 [Mycena metata]